MGETYRYSLVQLMELAGLSIAQATHDFIEKDLDKSSARILTVCGPGNNGGDGLVAARHLKLFGHTSSIYYPKPTSNELYCNLQNLALKCEVTQITELPQDPAQLAQEYDLIIDAIFGFSFQASGDIREPFGSAIELLKRVDLPVVAVDIPSGWHVE